MLLPDVNHRVQHFSPQGIICYTTQLVAYTIPFQRVDLPGVRRNKVNSTTGCAFNKHCGPEFLENQVRVGNWSSKHPCVVICPDIWYYPVIGRQRPVPTFCSARCPAKSCQSHILLFYLVEPIPVLTLFALARDVVTIQVQNASSIPSILYSSI